MAKTISELRNQSIQVRDASAAGENTATRVGTVLNDIVGHIEDYENTQSSNNSSQDAKIEGVKSSLNAEIARAKTEESNLSTQIGTERTERQAAVSKEETARLQADAAEKAARMAADNTEQDARIKADNAEKTARENADITLRTMIQTEVSDREKAVAAEAARAKAEEGRLQGEINNTNTNVETLDDKVNSNHDHLVDEVARLDLTDNEIKADLEAEAARAKAAEEANATAIAEEKAAIMGTDRIADGAVTYDKLQPEIKEVVEDITYTENTEFVSVKIDAKGKILEGIRADGTKVFLGNIESPTITMLHQAIVEEKAAIMGTDRIADGAVTYDKLQAEIKDVAEATEYVDSCIFIKVTCDKNGKIIEGVTHDGVKYVNKLHSPTIQDIGYYENINSVYVKTITGNNGEFLVGITKTGDIVYGNGLPSIIRKKINELKNEINTNISLINTSLNKLINIIDETTIINDSTEVSEFYRNRFVVFNYPSTLDGILKEIKLSVYKEDLSLFGLHLYVGNLDQRNWFINPSHYFIPINTNKNNSTLNVEDLNIPILKGQVLGVYSSRASLNTSNEPIGKGSMLSYTSSTNDRILTSTDIKGTFVEGGNIPTCFSFTVRRENSEYFYTINEIDKKEEIINTKINNISADVYNLRYVKDEVTGVQYRLIVHDGTLSIRSNNFKNILFIGSSFTQHGVAESVGWYSTGSMAPSVIQNGMTELVLRGLQRIEPTCKMTKLSSVSWERGYDDFDFTSAWLPKLLDVNPDAIYLHVSGNSTWTETFRSACFDMLNFLRKNSYADIFVAASWHGGQKAIDMKSAADEVGVTYVDLSSYKIPENYWKLGDYTFGDFDNQLHEIWHSGVAIHPNDIGCLQQANGFLVASGHTPLEITKNIYIVQAEGGIIDTPNTKWIPEGYVTLRVYPETGKTLDSISIKDSEDIIIEATNHINDYGEFFTFVMPDKDVTVEPKWI